jgi:farnesyl-diphosphate farnesyltransferase
MNSSWQYCEKILPEVSRTFTLNIGELKGDTHKATLLGYLFFRIADTFEDNKFQDETQKIKALLHFADIFRGNKNLNERLKLYKPLKLQWEDNSPEKNLLQNGDRAIRCYFDLPTIYREIIDRHIALTSEGMAKFQKKKRDSSTEFFQLQDINDLEEYCYYVAGVVGEMLTQIFSQQSDIATIKSQLEDHQIQFGLALQMTNIMKDHQKDIDRGWCYIPASITEICGITLDKAKSLSVGQKRRILSELTPVILSYFDSTLKYIKIIPVTQRAIRMFCIIPFVLAYNTLYNLVRMKGDKLSRGQVTALLTKCNSFAESNELLEKDYLKIHRKLI